jgi:histidinol phosphatase-like enzyme
MKATVDKYRMDSDCRKPKPGMVLQAAKDLNIDISRSLMVGDKESDRIELPELKSIIIKSKYVPENWDVEDLKAVEGYLQ